MITVNKDNQDAINYVTNIINGQWQAEYNRYINIGYGEINKSTYRAYCLTEQNYFCCYCCRIIANDSSTELEHIIPRSITSTEALQPYFVLSSILARNIVLQDSFLQSSAQQATPPFPHHIAYHNIVASCNGKIKGTSEDFNCNRNRSNDFIPPFNLMPNSIKYQNDGVVYYVNDEIDNRYLKPLNLNKELLKNIRRIWFLFAKSDVTLTELLQINNEESILEVITLHLEVNPFKSVTDRNKIDSFKTLSNWDTLMKYQYFLNYFRTNNL